MLVNFKNQKGQRRDGVVGSVVSPAKFHFHLEPEDVALLGDRAFIDVTKLRTEMRSHWITPMSVFLDRDTEENAT